MKKLPVNGLLRNKQYQYLIGAQVVSSLGDWLDMLALLALVAIKLNVSPLGMSGVMLCLAVPSIMVGPVAGILADRFERKKVNDFIRSL